MKTRKLGIQGLEVSSIGLGCMGMSIQYGELDDEESIATIKHSLDIGVNLINTSDAYGAGKNEELIAKAIVGRRGDALLNTKFGNIRDSEGKPAARGDPDYVIEACEKSLQRLGTDYFDIYSQHRVDTNLPIEDTVGAMSRLIEQGKVRYIGLSEAAPETVRRAHAPYSLSCLETEYSLWSRDVEAEILPLCQELGISLLAYAPLGRGFLSGSIRSVDDLIEGDRRRDHPRFAQDNIDKNIEKVKVVEQIAANKGFTPAQIAIAWVLAQDDYIVPIPGTKHRNYIDENAAAVDLSLTGDEIKQLSDAFPTGNTAGERYPTSQLRLVGL